MTTPTEWQDRAERAEAELARLREQAPVATFRVTSRPYDMGRAEWMAHQGAPLKDGDLLYAAPPAQPAPRKMEIPPPMAEPLDVVYAEGWNAACDAFFGGLPPLEPLVVTIGAQPAAQPVQLTDPAYRTFGEFMALQDAPDVDVVESARIGWNACAAVQGQPCDYGEGYDIEAAPPAQPDDRTAQIVRPLPETMSRDEMLQHYSAHANLCAHEALQYQKRIRDLEKALAAQPAAQPVQQDPTVNRYCRAGMCVKTDEQHAPGCTAHNKAQQEPEQPPGDAS